MVFGGQKYWVAQGGIWLFKNTRSELAPFGSLLLIANVSLMGTPCTATLQHLSSMISSVVNYSNFVYTTNPVTSSIIFVGISDSFRCILQFTSRAI